MAGDVTYDTATPHPRRAGLDRWLALAVFLALGAIYVATLLPGLGGTEDTPKFQYVGAALGTPHDPGYPLYMIACWAASKLPVGTLAYRINLLSACWGALAGALVFLAMRRLAVPRGIAVCTALALGLGRALWQHSTFAEAYTQAAALTAAAFLALLIWDEDGRNRWLYAAVAVVSLAFGTHLIVVGMIPAFAWFVLTRYRWRVPLRVLAIVGVIVVLGVAQYGYVWIRTAQHARYLEARATSISDMVGTLRGRQFENQTFKEPLLALLQTRIPEVATAAYAELGALSGVAALAGVLALWRTRRRQAVLLALACLGPTMLLASLGTVATVGIQLPSLMPAWMLAGCGFAAAWNGAAGLKRRRTRVAVHAAVAIAILAAPVVQAAHNYAASNSRGDTYETDYFGALFQQLGDRTAFVDEHYTMNHYVEYSRYTTGLPGVVTQVPRDPNLIAGLLRDGYAVYSFPEAFQALAGMVRYRTVTLLAPSLDARLQQFARGLVVVVAGSADRWPSLNALRLGGQAPRTGRAAIVALNGIGPVAVAGNAGPNVLELRAGEPIGDTGLTLPVSIRVELAGQQTSIAVDGQMVVQTRSGLAVAEIGSMLRAHYTLLPTRGFRPELDMSRRPLYRIVGVREAEACTSVGDATWRPLIDPGFGGRLVGRVDNYRPFDATWVVYLDASGPLPARLHDWSGTGTPSIVVESFAPRVDADRLRRQLAADNVLDPAAILSSSVVTRVAVSVNDRGESSTFRVSLGGTPVRGWGVALTDLPSAQRARVCGDVMEPLVPDLDAQQASVYLGPGGDTYFGEGWHNADQVPAGYFRRADGPVACMVIPIEQPASITLRLSVEALSGARAVAPVLNGRRLIEQRLTAGVWNDIEWPIASGGWRAGVNMLSLEVIGPAVGDAATQGIAPPAGAVAAPAGASPSLRVRRVVLDWSAAKSSPPQN